MLNQFWKFSEQFVRFTPKEKDLIISSIILRDVPRSHILVDLEEIAKELYFINKGLLRFYYLTENGDEVTGFIFEENMFAASVESFLTRQPSTQVLEALEDSELLVIPYHQLQLLYEKVPKLNMLIRKILEIRLAFAQKIVASLIINKPQDRYTAYQNLHPGIENRIPQHILASYMGITPVSLSRIRKRISQKK